MVSYCHQHWTMISGLNKIHLLFSKSTIGLLTPHCVIINATELSFNKPSSDIYSCFHCLSEFHQFYI